MTATPDPILDSLPTTPEARAALRKALAEKAWQIGSLRYLLDEAQREIHDAIDAKLGPIEPGPAFVVHELEPTEDDTPQTAEEAAKTVEALQAVTFYLLCHRGFGKSVLLVTYAFEVARQNPGARILYLAPTGKEAREIVNDIVDLLILRDCPTSLRPTYDKTEHEYTLPNGSKVRFRGVNSEALETLRGPGAHLIICDEAGGMDQFSYLLRSVITPMVNRWKGKILIATTPSKTPAHDSTIEYERCAGAGLAVRYTLLESKRKTWKEKAKDLREAGEDPADIPAILAGQAPPKTTTALREYWCEFVTEAKDAVLPEWRGQTILDLVKEHPRPAFFDAYEAIDPGMRDRTGIVYGWVDWMNAVLVIEDENLLHQANTQTIADAIQGKEITLWGDRFKDHPHGTQRLRRVSDTDLRLIADLRALHRLDFEPAVKQDAQVGINLLRNLINARKIRVHPRCVHLKRQMENAIWNRKGNDFDRPTSETSIDGHYDLVAALKYLVRAVNWDHNPFPVGVSASRHGVFVSPKGRKAREGQEMGLYANTPAGRRLAKVKKGTGTG